jgi:hypothetical protein
MSAEPFRMDAVWSTVIEVVECPDAGEGRDAVGRCLSRRCRGT